MNEGTKKNLTGDNLIFHNFAKHSGTSYLKSVREKNKNLSLSAPTHIVKKYTVINFEK